MKKERVIFVFAALIIGVALIFSCQKEEATNEGQDLTLKCATINCGGCVTNWMDSKVTLEGWTKYNKPSEAANIKLDVYNDGANVYYKVYRPSGTFGEVWINGVQSYLGAALTNYCWQMPLSEGWKACDPMSCAIELRGVSGGTGRTNNKTITYYLREKCASSDCEEEFKYVANGNNSFTFTYTPAQDMKDQKVVFTFAQGTAVAGLDDTWSTNGSTRQKNMDFTKCEPVSWTVTLTPDCSGHSGKSNVFTDFKVNDVSKKGNVGNIEIACPN